MVEVKFLILFPDGDTTIYWTIGSDYNNCLSNIYNIFPPDINFTPLQKKEYDYFTGSLIKVIDY